MRKIIGIALLFLFACQANNKKGNEKEKSMENTINAASTATFGAGCFWCVETLFAELKGVAKVESGYMGGQLSKPTYKEVCTGRTGHAEVVHITFDSSIISYETLLEIFWSVHDPTTLNQQGGDKGTQYRSAVFYHSPAQKEQAIKVKSEIEVANIWDNPIVTEITEATTFYVAENYHQDYYNNNPEESYCKIVINPKVRKFRDKFKSLLKE